MKDLDQRQRDFLAKYGFDAELQESWQRDVRAGRLSTANNLVRGPLLPPPPGSIVDMPPSGSAEWQELDRVGREAIARGELGVAILNGGMATRFGGVVKGVVEVRDGRSFLSLAVDDAQRHARANGGRVPVFLMNSFATDDATKKHFAEHGDFGADSGDVEHYTQLIALRMTPDGELFRMDDGEVSPYGPGHGDFAPAFRASGCLQRFRERGGRYLFVRNVDNLGARVSPAVLGHHIRSGKRVTAEQTSKLPGDVGGAPYLHGDRVQLVEQFRFPKDFDHSVVDVFNTNTMTFDADALEEHIELGWYYVEKKVEGRVAVQVEHLIGELTAHLPTNFLRVSREGTDSRFLPIKAPDDLTRALPEIAALYDN